MIKEWMSYVKKKIPKKFQDIQNSPKNLQNIFKNVQKIFFC